MKKLLLLFAFLIPLIGTGQNEWVISKVFENIIPYKNHFIADEGIMQSDRYTKAYYLMAVENEMEESILFGWMGEAASSKRSDGIYDYYEKIYDVGDSVNNGSQTTEASQTYVFGGIVPSTNEGMQNPNGDTRYMTHPEISFAADEPWSVTTCFAINGISSIWGKVGSGRTAIIKFFDSRDFYFTNDDNTSYSGIGTTNNSTKNQIVTFVADGSGNLSLYINGGLDDSRSSVVTTVAFDAILYNRVGNYGYGTISAHYIRNIALDSTQVANEANFLQTLYPPIAYKAISGYNIATTSIDVIASSDGTVITEAADNTDWATGLARWRYYSEDSEIGSWGNKLYNKAARDVIVANPPDGWHVATEAELTVIAAIDGDNLKVEGTDYWTTANGTNFTGLSAVGSGMVNTDGTFTGINTTVGFWCADSDKALIITDAGAATITSVSANEGYSIRLIED